MGVGAGFYVCDVVKKFTFAISFPDEFLSLKLSIEFGTAFSILHILHICIFYSVFSSPTFPSLILLVSHFHLKNSRPHITLYVRNHKCTCMDTLQ